MVEANTGGVLESQSDMGELVRRISEDGILAGILGAVVVAVWYLIIDMVTRGVPFFTPSLLGQVAFAGVEASEVAEVDGAALFAYTGLHGLLFLTAGLGLAWMFMQFERNPQFGLIFLLLFVTFEAILWGVGVSILPGLAGVVGAWSILVANLASAAVMFLFLLRRHPRALEGLREAWND